MGATVDGLCGSRIAQSVLTAETPDWQVLCGIVGGFRVPEHLDDTPIASEVDVGHGSFHDDSGAARRLCEHRYEGGPRR